MTKQRGGLASSLWIHAGLLGVVLLVILPLVGPYGSVSVDEGAAAYQAQLLEDGRGWATDPPIASIPIEDLRFPLTSAEPTDDGWAPYVRHPLYPVLLAGSIRVAGDVGMVTLSVVALVLAAAGSGVIAGRIGDRRLAVLALWTTGVATPLLFDGYLLIAHAIGAACAVWSAVLLVDAMASSTRRGNVPRLVGLAGLVAVGALLRSELVLLAPVSAGLLVLVAARSRALRYAAGGAVLVVGAGASLLLERAWRRAIGVDSKLFNGPVRSVQHGVGSWFDTRLDGVQASVVNPGAGRWAPLLVGAVVLLAVASWLARDGRSRLLAAAAAGLAVVAVAVRAAAGSSELVPGLLIACPLLVIAPIVGFGRARLEGRTWFLLAASGLTALAITALQYEGGGFVEWGGRYFAVLLPVVVPLALLVLVNARMQDDHRRVLLGSVAFVAIGLSALSIVTLRDINVLADATLEDITSLSVPSELASTPGDLRPIVITSQYLGPRLDWRRYDDRRWVFIGSVFEPETAPGIDPQVRSLTRDLSGARQVTLVSVHLTEDLPRLGPHRVVGETGRAGPFEVAVVQLL